MLWGFSLILCCFSYPGFDFSVETFLCVRILLVFRLLLLFFFFLKYPIEALFYLKAKIPRKENATLSVLVTLSDFFQAY